MLQLLGMFPGNNPSGSGDAEWWKYNSNGSFQNDVNQPNFEFLDRLVPGMSRNHSSGLTNFPSLNIETRNSPNRELRDFWNQTEYGHGFAMNQSGNRKQGVNHMLNTGPGALKFVDDEVFLDIIQNRNSQMVERKYTGLTKPDRPSVRFDKGDDNRVIAYIAWNAPNCNHFGYTWPVTGYTLDISSEDDSLILQIKGNNCKAESDGLRFNTKYSFKVKAQNNLEEGPYSDETCVRSPPGPPSRVKGLKAIVVLFSVLLLQFEEPNSNGSDIESYVFEIEVKSRPENSSASSNNGVSKTSEVFETIEDGGDENSNKEFAKYKDRRGTRKDIVLVKNVKFSKAKIGDKKKADSVIQHVQHLIEKLDHSTSYRICVQAVNHVGTGLASEFLEVVTYSLPQPPARITSCRSYSNLKFAWEPVPIETSILLQKSLEWLNPSPVSYNVKLRYPYELNFFDIYQGTDVNLQIPLLKDDDTVDVRISSGFENMFSPSYKTFRFKLTDKLSKDISWNILTKRVMMITGMESLCDVLQKIKTGHIHSQRINMIKEAQRFCERELAKFELEASKYFLETGILSSNMFTFDDMSEKYVHIIKKDLQQGSCQSEYGMLWNGVMRLIELVEAIMEKNFTNIAKVYYKLQCRHTIFETDKPLEIPFYIMNSLTSKWKTHLRNAIDSINLAAPGLNLYITKTERQARVKVGYDEVNTRVLSTPSTRPLNKEKGTVFIHLPKDYPSDVLVHQSGTGPDDLMAGSVIHEILHALNFDHHYQRFDAELYLSIDESLKEQQPNDFRKTSSILNLVRHDLSSILHTNEQKGRFEKIEGDPYSALKTNCRRSCELSEGDKVALNLKYKPCISERYNPEVKKNLGIVYCGRPVMKNHDQFSKGTTDTHCGPNNWANCPACRVILDIVHADGSLEELPKVRKCIADGRWQGLNGLFYCGKTYSSEFIDIGNVKRDGVCGPDVGIPCTDCGKIMYPAYSIEMYLPRQEPILQPVPQEVSRMEQNPKSVSCTIS